MTTDPIVSIEVASGHAREQRTATELRQLMQDHDLSGLRWTDRVVVQFKAGAHSHPVLTLNTLYSGDRLLTTYIHEQVHWWVADHPGIGLAMEDSKGLWPSVPGFDEGGAMSEFSTRLHLAVCHMEHRAMEHLIGRDRAEELLDEQIQASPSYPWIRTQVRKQGPLLDRMFSNRALWPDRLAPKD